MLKIEVLEDKIAYQTKENLIQYKQMSPELLQKKYAPDGNVQKEFNKGHQGKKTLKNEKNDHVHDYKPNPNNPSGRGERQPGRPLKKYELEEDF